MSKFTPKGEARPVLGRKFCSKCGKWRLLIDFCVAQRSRSGHPLRWQSACHACERQRERVSSYPRRVGRKPRDNRAEWQRIKRDERRLALYREYHRMYQEQKRRREGIEPRFKGGLMPREYRARAEVPAGPFIEWLDAWKARQEEMRGAWSQPGFERPVASLEDLAGLAGTSSKRFREARVTGVISLRIVDAVLTRASDTCLECMYREEDYPELYQFDEVEVAA